MINGWDGVDEVVAVHAAGSFSGGARALGMSTSQMSRAIARLEDRLQSRVFNRTTRCLSLTDVGSQLVGQFEQIIRDRDEALAMVNGAGEPHGILRLTCSVALGERFIVPILRRYAETFPRLSIDFELTNRVVDLIAEGFDLGIRTGASSDTRLSHIPLLARRLHLCAAPDYLAARGVPRTVDDLAGHECLRGNASEWTLIERGRLRSVRPTGRWRCNSGGAVLHAALTGMGIAQLPDIYVAEPLESGRLVEFLSHSRPADEPVWAVYPRRHHLTSKVARFVEMLQRQLPHDRTVHVPAPSGITLAAGSPS